MFRNMFELCDCGKDGSIDLCDFISMYCQNPNPDLFDFLGEWKAWVSESVCQASIIVSHQVGDAVKRAIS